MIVSHKHKFIFIKTAKTAGTSIEVYLSRHCGENDIVTVNKHEPEHIPRNWCGFWNPFPEMRATGCSFSVLKRLAKRKKFFSHIYARAVRSLVPENVWNDYFKFCVERNPWEKTLSQYHMDNYRRGGRLTLEKFFKKGRFPVNFPKYTDAYGNLLVDKVIRYESLTEGLSSVFHQLGIPFNGDLGLKSKGHFRTDRRPYQEVFTDGQRQVIEKIFADEIRMHGYRFDAVAPQELS